MIRLESRRQAAKDRKQSLERDAQRILDELDNLDAELQEIDEEVGESLVRDEITRLRERVNARRDGDVILRIGSRVYRIDRDIIKALPFGYGNLLLAWARVVEGGGKRR